MRINQSGWTRALALLLVCALLLVAAPVRAEEGVWVVSPEDELDFAVLLTDPSWTVEPNLKSKMYVLTEPGGLAVINIGASKVGFAASTQNMIDLAQGLASSVKKSSPDLVCSDPYAVTVDGLPGQAVDYTGTLSGRCLAFTSSTTIYMLLLVASKAQIDHAQEVFDGIVQSFRTAKEYATDQAAKLAPTPKPTAEPTTAAAAEPAPAAEAPAVDLSQYDGEWIVSPPEEYDFAALLIDPEWTGGPVPEYQLYILEGPKGVARIYVTKLEFGFAAEDETMVMLVEDMGRIMQEENKGVTCGEVYPVTVDGFPGQAIDYIGGVYGTMVYCSTPTTLYGIQLLADKERSYHAQEVFDVFLLSFRTAEEYEADPPQREEPDAADEQAAGQAGSQPAQSGPSQMTLADAESTLKQLTLRTDYASTRIDDSAEFPTTLYLDENGKLLYSVWNNVYGDTVTPCRQDWYYDEQGRLVASVSYENGIMMVIHLYSYDAEGNRTSQHFMIEGAQEALIASYRH